ncbi:MAG TPA: hypothetical protein EYH56_00830 [Nanoarchaeota archaeon]|nr:hypothetical protein [Nanoarchaeota archaeon]
MIRKALSLNLEFLVRIIVFALVVFGLAYLLFGKDFLMKMEALNTQKRLVDAFIEVAKNYEEYNYSYRYGGKSNGDVVICEVPYLEKKPCGVPIILPQELNMISKEALPALGDPKYIIYWDRYENVESDAWSGWFYLDVALIFLGGPISKGIIKGGKIAGKLIFKYGTGIKLATEAAKLLGRGTTKLGKAVIHFTGGSIKIGGKKVKEPMVKDGKLYVIRAETGDDMLSALDEIAKGLEKGGDKEAAKRIDKFKQSLKDYTEKAKKYFNVKNLAFILPSKTNIKKASTELKKRAPIFFQKLKILIENNQAWICSFSGAALGIASPEVIIETLKNAGYITDEDAQYYYFNDGTEIAKEITQTAAWSLLLKKVTENGRTKIKTLLLKKDPSSPTGYSIQEVDLMDITSKNMKDWIVYEIDYNPNTGKIEAKPLGKVKEILENEELKERTVKNCLYGVSVTFAPIFIAHTLEAKYETVKGEAEKCRNAICIKGPGMAPKTYKKKELMDALKNSKICGIKVMNANRKLEFFYRGFKETGMHNFYLASPCFAYAQFWIGDCEDPTKICDNICSKWYDETGECKNEVDCCRQCIWVSLQEGKFMSFQENSAFNFCVRSSTARTADIAFQMPWPWAGYWWFG